MTTDTCQSGGASGADLAWGREAARLGHKVVHFSFAGHGTRAPRTSVVELAPEALQQADQHLARASRKLGRVWPPASEHPANLLRRNWYQVRNAERVYAVGRMAEGGQIEGGAAWGLAMFIDRHGSRPCEAYFFDQDAGRWFKWSPGWAPIMVPPVPHGIWAGIGTRDLNAAGEVAIKRLLDR